ncbi:putative minichromosome maintenance (MCM) complex subunit [Leishmania infantum JPCM5]|uniref:DNA replication licensing factor MCM2 n=2 Tax=Leishmania infantum TaxID=5671 RepID=A0A6L0XTF2_LEIIN|nr:putative minichromosome maintenance (MCM) complex subunit [Leishmania infantum JPCM5]CAC9502548.1 DNA_replication_licensing_factor_MCM2_-_putative [Leishmania infantum]CAM69316.1 putative minichromosome maintenance (MCM) complex subunit [Leishmania infantum JPCM5]SUZ43254.1 DNA_replication_licensing_factor_MCM2_-_putative [Leishmania infantum]|eukprot:XP_001470124.1 putative minichromosome maintenance (MCM) complex subunit [Leishmania infantum JPCM5]
MRPSRDRDAARRKRRRAREDEVHAAGPHPPRREEVEDDDEADHSSGDEANDEEGEDLYGENFMQDYLQPDEESEVAEEEVGEDNDWIADDDSSVSEISEGGRIAVDELLERRREKEEALAEERRQLQEGIFSDVDDDDGDDDDDASWASEEGAGGLTRSGGAAVGDQGSDIDHGEDVGYGDPNDEAYVRGDLESMNFNWRQPQGELVEWLAQELPRRVIKNRIYNFYYNYIVNDVSVYEEKVNAMTRENDKSFQLSYDHLSRVYDSVLALWLVDAPDPMIELLEEAANYFTFKLYPQYRKVHSHIFVRICDLPLCDPIRDFRQVHMNVLVRVEGVVIRRSPVYPQMDAVKYDCARCSYIIGPIYQRGDKEQRVSMCPSCHSKGPFRVNMRLTEYRNHQTIVLQEPPGKVPPGRLPRSLEVVLTNDLIDRAKPGEEVDVTGIYRNNFDPLLNSRQGFPVFTTVLHANNVIRRTTELGMFRLPDDERQRIIELSKSPNIRKKLLQSIAPSIHGRDDIKLGLLLAMMGAVPKDIGGDQSHRIRGDINVLMVGDPGCAKSQFLKFVEKTADRTVFTTGRGSTAVGLTASVHKDSVNGDFVLEGGALVIADRGCCLIDEFDKMSDQDRTSIHEAMEQQTISVARGGIVTTLSARCCIIAAANPMGGRYDPSTSFDANVNLTTPILSRFDLLFVVRDEVNVELDERLATFICDSHMRNHPRTQEETRLLQRDRHEELSRLRYALENASTEGEREECEEQLRRLRESVEDSSRFEDDDPDSDKPLPQSLLRKYILFAKSHCFPRISNIDPDTIARLYVELRQESKHGGIAITVRHMESVIRLSEAHARVHLREYVTDEDVTAAVSLFLRCFIQTQKYSLRSAMEARFRKFLESDTESLPLIRHRIKVAVQTVRQFERQLSGGVEPTQVRIDVSELDYYTANMSQEALNAFYESAEFRKEYRLIRDPVTHAPLQIEHSLA